MITITILTKNSSRTLGQTLESAKEFPSVLVYDTGSTDETLEIAKKFPNVKILQGPFIGFGKTHNVASSLAECDWILSLDSDEILSPELAREILSLSLDPRSVYSISRDNYFNGKKIRGCAGWYPDPVIRLYNRKETRFSDDAVHEKIETKGVNQVALKHPVQHTPYLSLSDFLVKMDKYSSLFAEENKDKKKSSLGKAIFHGLHAFFKSYILKRGFLCGKEGFIISFYNAEVTYYKYLKIIVS